MDLWQRPQQLAVQLAKLGNKIVYLNPIQKSRVITDNPIEFMKEKLHSPEINDDVIWYDMINFINCKENTLNTKQDWLKMILDSHSIDIIIVYLPDYVPQLREYKNLIDIYFDCVDDLEGFYTSKKIILLENELVKMSKGVIVTSKTLYVHKSKLNSNTILVPNGVVPEQFYPTFDKPKDLSNYKKPIVGYMGAIAGWFDQELLIEVASMNKDKDFVLVGTIYTDVSKMEQYPNIHLLGKREYSEVPAYINHFDIGIIPFKMNDLIINTNPIKYFEYLAAGLNTLATPMPELIGEPHSYLAEDPPTFSKLLNELLKRKVNVNEREYLKENSWESRGRKINDFICGEFHTTIISRRQNLEGILGQYKTYSKSSPILSVLKSEILHEIDETDMAKEEFYNNELGDSVWNTQIKLLACWGDLEKVKEKFLSNPLMRKDAKKLLELDDKLFIFYMLRKTNQLEMAANNTLNFHSEWVHEEIANFYFDVEMYGEALPRYFKLFSQYNYLVTKEGYIKFSKLVRHLGKVNLANELEKMSNSF